MLWSLAVAQPLYGILEDSPEFFVARGNDAGDIVMLTVFLSLVAPSLLFLVELAFAWNERARRTVHLLIVAVLASAFVLQLIRDMAGGGRSILVAGVVLGAAAAAVYARIAPVRTGLTVISPLPVVLALLFLFASPVSKLVLPQHVDAVSASVRSQIPVVFVVFDEFPSTMLENAQGRLDASRFPNFARLARHATWYRNATTVADLTPQAVPAELTGELPEPGQLPVLADHPDNLFTLLADRYAFHVQEPVSDLCPERLCHERESRESLVRRMRSLADDLSVVYAHRVAPTALEDDLPVVDQAFGGFRRTDAPTGSEEVFGQLAFDDRRALFERFVSGVRGGTTRPPLDFIHIELPHVPTEYLPDGRQYRAVGDPPFNEERWPTVQAYQRHLLQVGFSDHLLGELLRRLEREGIYRRALVVVTADHGASYRVGEERRRLTTGNADDIAGIPLLIKGPNQRTGRTDTAPARSIDILPTIADYLRVDLGWEPDGRSLLRDLPADRRLAVIPQRGETVTLTPAEFVARHDAELARMSRLFPPGPAGLFAAGPAPDLVGRPVSGVAAAGRTGLRARLDNPAQYGDVDPEASFAPAFVSARLDGTGGRERDVAIAVNGTVAAVSRSYGSDEPRVYGMVDPARFSRGRNDIRLYEVLGSPEARRLAPLERNAFRLVTRGGETRIEASGASYRVVPGAVQGRVEQVNTAFRVVTGWAGQVDRGRPADRVVLFQDGRFVGEGAPALERADVAASQGSGLRRSGFAVVTDSPEAKLDPKRVRVFAIAGSRASQLGD